MRYKFEDIKPIPKYIEKLIKKRDDSTYAKYFGQTRFYSYLTKIKKSIAQIYVAVKNKGNVWTCKQVAVHIIDSNECAIKDIAYFTMAGYIVGWYEQGFTKYPKFYEGDWVTADDKYFNMFAPVINKEFALKFPQYKYSAVDKYSGHNIIKYLRIYEKYPIAEMLIKLGLDNYATSKTLLHKLTQDKSFRKWIYKNQDEIHKNCYYCSTILLAYKTLKPFKEIQDFEKQKKSFIKNECYKKISKYIKTNELKEFFTYISNQKTNFNTYVDYLSACENLNVDLDLEKNKYPHNFKRWHNIRIDQYHTKQLGEDAKKRKKFYKKFAIIADKYKHLERDLNESYVVIIAKSPSELMTEGFKLNHCVGRMNYDQKFAREESLIFFIRNKGECNEPFVTLEYSLRRHSVLQCYGYNDRRPSDEVLEFVNKKWLPYANRKIREIA